MTAQPSTSPSPVHSLTPARALLAALTFIWNVVRLALLATLLAFEPLVRVVFSSIAVLGILMALFFEYLIRLPHFPFWLMLGLSIGSAALLVPYYALIGALDASP